MRAPRAGRGDDRAHPRASAACIQLPTDGVRADNATCRHPPRARPRPAELIRHLNDPEHPLTLEQLKVASLEGVTVDDAGSKGAMRPAARPTARCVRRHVRAFPTGHSLLVRHRSPRRS